MNAFVQWLAELHAFKYSLCFDVLLWNNRGMQNIRNQLICAHSVIPFALFFGLGVLVMPGWLPPPSARLAASDIATIFEDSMRIRFGLLLGLSTAPFFLGLAAAICAQLRRLEGPHHVMSYVQLSAGIVGTLFLMLPPLIWFTLSFRPQMDAIAIVLNDLAWFILLATVAIQVVQNLAIGIAVLGAEDERIYPRWYGYLNIWLCLTLLPGAIIPFFLHGPFARDGIFGFWLVAIDFFGWLAISYVWTVKAIHQQACETSLLRVPSD